MIRKSVMPERSELRQYYILAVDNYVKAITMEIKKNNFLYSYDTMERIDLLKEKFNTYPEDGLWVLFKELVNL